MGNWIFGLIVGVIICVLLPPEKIAKLHELSLTGLKKLKEKIFKKKS